MKDLMTRTNHNGELPLCKVADNPNVIRWGTPIVMRNVRWERPSTEEERNRVIFWNEVQ